MKMCISPDGSLIASGSDDGAVLISHQVSGRPLLSLSGHAGPITFLVFSQDGTQLTVEFDDGTVEGWDVASGRMLQRLSSEQ